MSKEIGFDYLRDRLALQQRRRRGNLALDRLFDASASKLRLTGVGFAIVDEADSLLIDEARPPLIIAARDDAAQSIDQAKALQMAASLRPGEHYELLIDRRAAELTDRGREFLATITASFGGVGRYRRPRDGIARQPLSALLLYA